MFHEGEEMIVANHQLVLSDTNEIILHFVKEVHIYVQLQ